jgi:hypothetical protein
MGKFAETAIVDYRLSFVDQGKQTSLFRFCLHKQREVCSFCFPFAANKRKLLCSICRIPETWKQGIGDMDMETWTWRHGDGDMET